MIRVASLIVLLGMVWGMSAPASAQPWEKKYADKLVFSSNATDETKTITILSAALVTGGWTYTLPDAGASASFALTTSAGATLFSGPTATRTYTLPDATTTILTTNAAVTVGQGGTGAALTASNGGIFYSTGSAGAILSGTATANQILLSGASVAPTWSTATYPSGAALGDVLIGSATNAFTSLTGNTTSTKNFLTQTGNGTISAAPVWGTIGQADVSGLTTGSSPTFAGMSLGTGALSTVGDITMSGAADHVFSMAAPGGTASGHKISITGASGSTTGTGGAVAIAGGAGAGVANGGAASLTGGSAGTSGVGGAASVVGGPGVGTDQLSGGAIIDAGNSTGAGTSTITFKVATPGTTGAGTNTSASVATLTSTGMSLGGNLQMTSATNNKVTTSNAELVLEQTGDTYGTTRLHIQNRNGSNGALFEMAGQANIDLVDFGFKPNAGVQSNMRLEARAATVRNSANSTFGEFQFLMNSLGVGGTATNNFSTGEGASSFEVGNVGIGLRNPGQKLTVYNGNLLLSNGGTADQLQLQGTGTGISTFQAGAQSTTSFNYTLPITIPSANQVLAATSVSAPAVTLGWSTPYSNPMTTSGDMLYEDVTPTPTRLAGNTTATKNFLTMTSAVPAWGTIGQADVTGLTTGSSPTFVGLTLSGAISGGTSYSGSGNINTTGGALQTNSTTRIDNAGAGSLTTLTLSGSTPNVTSTAGTAMGIQPGTTAGTTGAVMTLQGGTGNAAGAGGGTTVGGGTGGATSGTGGDLTLTGGQAGAAAGIGGQIVLQTAASGTGTTLTTRMSISPAGIVNIPGSLTISTPLAVGQGGTGSSSQNFVDLSSTQSSIAGAKTFTALLSASLGLTITGAAVNLNASQNFATNINSGTSTGTVTIGGTAAQTISIGDGNSTGADIVNIGTALTSGAGSKTVNIATGASTVGINAVNIGTGITTVAGGNAIHIGDGTPTGSGTNLVTIGSTANASNTTIQSGSAAVNINASVNQPVNIGSGTSTGTVTIGGTGAQTISIGDGNSTGADVVNVGTALTSGAGSKTVNIATGASTVGINAVNIGTGITTVAGGNAIHIGDGTPTGVGTNLVTIGSTVGASALTLNAGSGLIDFNSNMTIDGSAARTITVAAPTGTGSGVLLTLTGAAAKTTGTGGGVTIAAGAGAAGGGGALAFNGGAGAGGTSAGGNITLTPGTAVSTGTPGLLTLNGAVANTAGPGGGVTIAAANGGGTATAGAGAGGSVNITAGNAGGLTNVNGGNINLTAGTAIGGTGVAGVIDFNSNMTIDGSAARTISVAAPAGAGSGVSLSITGAAATTTGNGGAVTITTGAGVGASGAGGLATLAGGVGAAAVASVSAAGIGGGISIAAGTGGGSATANVGAAGGAATLSAGTGGAGAAALAAGAGGALTISAGAGGTANTGAGAIGGAVTINGGNATGTGNNAGGSITLNGGTATGTGAVGSILLIDKVTKYNNIATVSGGMPAEYGTIDATAQGANIATATAYAVPVGGVGMYRVSVWISVTRAATTSSTMPSVTIGWTNGDGSAAQTNATTATSGGNSVTTTYAQSRVIVYAASSTNITYTTAGFLTSGATSMQYALHIKVEAL